MYEKRIAQRRNSETKESYEKTMLKQQWLHCNNWKLMRLTRKLYGLQRELQLQITQVQITNEYVGEGERKQE